MAESRKQGGVVSFSGVSRAQTAWERGIEPSQTPKFLPPFPWEGRRLFLVTVALSPRLLGWRHLGLLPREKRRPLPPFGVSASFLLPYAEHPPQDGGKDGGGAQDDDLHEDTFLSIYVDLFRRGGAGTASICRISRAGENIRKICRGQLTQVPFCGIL